MFVLTKQERTVVLFLAVIMLTGTIFDAALKKHPHITNIVNLIDSDRLFPKVNINSASSEELIAIPYIGEYTAGNIVRYREVHGPFMRIEDIKNVKGIRDKNYERFRKYLKVSSR